MGIDSKRLKKSYKHSVLRNQRDELFKPVYSNDLSMSPTASDQEIPIGEISDEDIIDAKDFVEKYLRT